MRWEDQELNHSTPETKFPEVLVAGLSLLTCACASVFTFVYVAGLGPMANIIPRWVSHIFGGILQACMPY